MIVFKTDKVRREWIDVKLDLRLKAIVYMLAGRMIEVYQTVPVITSIFRQSDTGVHGYWRGVDIRTNSLPDGAGDALASWVNLMFSYDPGRPQYQVALNHNVGLGAHLHLQIAAMLGKWSLVD